MSQYTTDPDDELDIHKIESAVKLYYDYTDAYTRHLLKEWLAEELRQAKEQGARTERERIAHLAESIRSAHDIAECAAPVEGETGRQECIDQWISICEEPDTWLRDLADDPEWLEAEFFEVWEIGYADGNGDNKTGTFTPNPYRSQE